MSKRPTRASLPQRDDSHRTRELTSDLSPESSALRFNRIRYGCSGKHKSNPYIYKVDPYRGSDSDRVLCDAHAGFTKEDMQQTRITALFSRAEAACLFGNLIWTVDDSGWIYELRPTNRDQNEWHGYPVLPSDAFAQQVWVRFSTWSDRLGSVDDKAAAQKCALMYGFKK